MVDQSVCHDFLEGREGTLSCSCRSTCFFLLSERLSRRLEGIERSAADTPEVTAAVAGEQRNANGGVAATANGLGGSNAGRATTANGVNIRNGTTSSNGGVGAGAKDGNGSSQQLGKYHTRKKSRHSGNLLPASRGQ